MAVPACRQAEQRKLFLEQFRLCQPVLSALGDPNRQLIIRTLVEHCDKGGLRVGDIQRDSHISRTAVSHHLKVLKDTGIISVRSEGTRNYYYINAESTGLRHMASFWQNAVAVMDLCPFAQKCGRNQNNDL